jgi:hypothetical protein
LGLGALWPLLLTTEGLLELYERALQLFYGAVVELQGLSEWF